MAFIICEGLDRSGKSSVAKLYESKGYKIIHMSAPNKKYYEPGYAGPSYIDEMLELYMKYTGQDVLFDRSAYGECVWPHVYGRTSLLSEEDFDVLRELEAQNSAEYILMYDKNIDAHWRRCVENKEPLDKKQFILATRMYDQLVHKYSFIKKQLSDYNKDIPVEQPKKEVKPMESPKIESVQQTTITKSTEQIKLEKANAINSILSNRIIKKKGSIYESIEKDIRDFLNLKLGAIFGTTDLVGKFNNEELQVLKIFCQRSLNKVKTEENR
jgi:hypothetical protein